MTPRQKTLSHRAVIVCRRHSSQGCSPPTGKARSGKLPSRHRPGLLQAGHDLRSQMCLKRCLPVANSGLPSSVGCGPFLWAHLSPLPSCHSVCLTCLLNRSPAVQADPALPRAHRPPPQPSEGPWKPRSWGGCFGGTGADGWVFYILLGALGSQSCVFE